ncbi:xanthine dehydrogenase family protein molybdopterin-binding subunit [Candidatus Formimonas warabiya]|uniref:Carbon monoxide dehydrogenase n=1 Tax=Formimonas warabiya TaxID=1761012 RepID=A0A3G1KZP5_FORW1|nr:xanthine dehydrogenase family protein molybdopterin-binding subunit [Candidatus Formimonas warabiya]ATW27859.1 carbon monoxide dehydrogenase [Candidatus Formimonas warabiya]
MSEPLKVGRSTVRWDAANKVAGAEKYAADYYPEDFLVIGIKRSPYAHARILNIDTSKAEEIPGVVAVLTHQEIKGSNRLGIMIKDQPILAEDKVRYIGDAVALVVAENKVILDQALAGIEVGYELLPPVFSLPDALAENSIKVHEERKDGNVLLAGKIEFGSVKEALLACVHKVEVELKLGCQEHACLETETGVAWLEEDGTLVITASTQSPFRDRLELAHAMGIAPERIRIMAPFLGGGFGRKDGITIQGYLALAAFHSHGRPVKIQLSREESTVTGTKRHATEISLTLGCDEKGQLSALCCTILMDTGAYASLGGEVLALAMEHAGGPYRIPNVIIDGKAVYTNHLPAGAFRGFGVPQVTAGIEQAIDKLAKAAGFDPLKFRLINAVKQGEKNSAGVVMTQSVGLTACLETVASCPEWKDRKSWINSAPPFTRRSVGMAAMHHAQGFGPVVPDNANAKIELDLQGCFVIYVGVVDMGQGNATTYLQMAGDILGQGFDRLTLVLPDTKKTLPSGSSSASRTTFTFGNALMGAAKILSERILDRAGLMLTFQTLGQVKKEELTLLPGRVHHLPTGHEVPLEKIAAMMDASERMAVSSYTCPTNLQTIPSGQNLSVHGYPHRVYSFGAQVVRLHIDTRTGEVTVDDVLTCIDAGRVINPILLEQQIEGAAAQGLGYALYEHFIISEGKVLTKDFSTYVLPTSLDIPPMRTITLALAEKDGPFGMKGAGEIGLVGVLPAVGNAIFEITGRRIKESPMNEERVLEALRQAGLECAR